VASIGGSTSEALSDRLQLLSAILDQSSSAVFPGSGHAAEHEYRLWSHRRVRHYLLWYRGMFLMLSGVSLADYV
jgi:hypothetical protein